MRKGYIRGVALLLLLLLLPVTLLVAALRRSPVYGESYYAELAAMTRRFDTAPGQRLVLLGGSSVAFGTDTELLEELLRQQGFDYAVCPMGLYAAVGADAMLSLTQGGLHQGDVVILTFEAASEACSTYFGATAFLKCAEAMPEMTLRLTGSQWAAVMGNLIPYLAERRAADPESNDTEGVYTRAAFNEACNLTYERAGNRMPLGYGTAEPIDLDALVIDSAFSERVNQYCQHAREVGAQVFLSFAPMNRSALTDASEEALQAYFDRCNAAFDCQIISDPADLVMDSGWFYDSNFHLNSRGSVWRTASLARDLLAALGCWAPVEVNLPTMPAPMASMARAEGDEDCFTYMTTQDGGGWMISGLTENGAERVSLTVPSTHEGLPVVGLTEDALDGAAMLEELTLPETVEALPGGLGEHCPRLSRLILTHETKPCAPGGLTDADAVGLKILVPAAAYSYYRDGYGCEASQWTRWLDRIFSY